MVSEKRRRQLLGAVKRWQQRNPGAAHVWRTANRERYNVSCRKAKWKARGYPAPTRDKPQLCECCGNPPNGSGSLHLDHDHGTGKFRGWLCSNCNRGLGYLQDSMAGILRAVDYLKRNS